MTAPRLFPILTLTLALAACGGAVPEPVRCEPGRDAPARAFPEGCPVPGGREDAPVPRAAPQPPPKPAADPAPEIKPDPAPDTRPAPGPKPGWGHGDRNHAHHGPPGLKEAQ